jgi:fatty-acyl-CoA synthase
MPKGCPLTHEALVRTALEAGRTRFELTRADRMWDPLPMFHMSFVLPLLACLDAGAALLSMERFEPGLALRYLRDERASVNFAAFPTITLALLSHPDFEVRDMHFRLMNNVGPPDLLRQFHAALPFAKHITAYGLTEAGGVTAFSEPSDDAETRATTAGRPFAGIEVSVRDPATNAALPAGTRGELCIRGYCLFEGYYKSPEKNAEAFDAEGWFHTGDLGTLDGEGRIAYLGRSKDMLKVGGENVAAVEIEGFLQTHPAVLLAQIVAAPDAKYGEVAAAFVQLRPGHSASEPELIHFCRGKIASFKVPRFVRFVDDWPMSATKIQKFKLRERIEKELAG